jgi:cytosine deaminase
VSFELRVASFENAPRIPNGSVGLDAPTTAGPAWRDQRYIGDFHATTGGQNVKRETKNVKRLSGGGRETHMDLYMSAALEEARKGLAEGGIPIGSVLVHNGKIIGRGHNRRAQKGSAILHGEMDALENAGRQPSRIYRESVLYTTLSPCPMCSGAILLYGIPKVVIGENRTFLGEEQWLRSHGVEFEVLQDDECIRLMTDFIAAKPELWNEDIGV